MYFLSCEEIKTTSTSANEFFRVVVGSIDKGRIRANRDSSKWLGKGWVCCVIDGITRCDALFFVLFHNKQ